MATEAKTSNSYVYRRGTTANTSLLNTQRVRLYSYDSDTQTGSQIGLVQTWNPQDSRTIEAQRGIGFGDQIAELAVGNTELTASCSIMMMYLKDIMQVFGYKSGTSGLIRSLKHHRWPFDVKEEIVIPSFVGSGDILAQGGVATATDGGGQAIITIYEGCWLSDYSKSFSMGDTSTTQDTSMSITDVYATAGDRLGVSETDDAGTSNNNISRLYGTASGGLL